MLRAAFEEGPAFVPYLVAGDPDLETAATLVETLERAGADAIELGLPFSDPVAEGPTIQAAIGRALAAGITPERYLSFVAGLDVSVPIVCMTYANPVYTYGEGEGPAAFVRAAADAGVDGLLVADVPLAEADPLVSACRDHDVAPVLMAAPTTPDERLERILAAGDGYVYVQARLGTTGARSSVSERTAAVLGRVRDVADGAVSPDSKGTSDSAGPPPLAVGFGIADGEQAAAVVDAGADGVIVGSALVERIGEALSRDRTVAELRRDVEGLARELALGSAASADRPAAAVRAVLARSHTRPSHDDGGSEPVSVQARSLQDAIRDVAVDGRTPVIAEVKPTSPTTEGTRTLDPVATAREMVAGGAAAVSVLTEPTHFGGSIADLHDVRSAIDVPVLRKDFVLQPPHLDAVPADAVLLIARFLPEDRLGEMIAAARERGMEPLVEVHDCGELERAVAADAELIGINNRDLRALTVDLETVERVAPAVPEDVTVVAESGMETPADVARMGRAGADAVLVGGAISGATDVARTVRDLALTGSEGAAGERPVTRPAGGAANGGDRS